MRRWRHTPRFTCNSSFCLNDIIIMSRLKHFIWGIYVPFAYKWGAVCSLYKSIRSYSEGYIDVNHHLVAYLVHVLSANDVPNDTK